MESGPHSIDKIVKKLQELQPQLEQQNADELVLLDVASAEIEIHFLREQSIDDTAQQVITILQRLKQYDNPTLQKEVNDLLQQLQSFQETPAAQVTASGTNSHVKGDSIEQLLTGLHQGSNKPYSEDEIKKIVRSLFFRMNPQEIINKLVEYRPKSSTDHASETPEQYVQNALLILEQVFSLMPEKLADLDLTQLLNIKEREAKEMHDFKAAVVNIIEDKRKSVLKPESNRIADHKIGLKSQEKHNAPVRLRAYIKGKMSNSSNLAKRIAADLKQENLSLLANIQPSEFLSQNWTKNHGPNLQKMIDFSTNTTLMVRDRILLARSKEEQVKLLSLYSKVIEQCITQGDFSSAISIYAAFSDSYIKRLKHLEEQITRVNDKYADLFKQDSNYANLAKKIAQRQNQNKEVVPYLMLETRNWTFLDDGNKDKFEDTQVINLGKLEMEGQLLETLLIKQALARDYLVKNESLPLTDVVLEANSNHLNDDDAYKISLAQLPRNSTVPVYDQRHIIENEMLYPAATSARKLINQYLTTMIGKSDTINQVPDFYTAKEKGNSLKWEQKFTESGSLTVRFKNLDVSALKSISPEVLARAFATDLTAAGYNVSMESIAEGIVELKGGDVLKFAKEAGSDFQQLQALFKMMNVPIQSLELASPVVATSVSSSTSVPEQVQNQPEILPEENSEPLIMASEEDEDIPANLILEKLLKQYSIKVYESKNTQLSKTRQEQAVREVKRIDEEINYIINKVNADTASNDPNVKSAAIIATAKMKNMIDKYQELRSYLQSAQPTDKLKSAKSTPAKIRQVVTKLKRFHKKKSLEQKPKDLLGLINALREETHQRTREVRVLTSTSKPAVMQTITEVKHQVKIEENPASKEVPHTVKEKRSDRQPLAKPNPSHHRVAFSNDILALDNLKERLADKDPQIRNSVRLQAMKQSVELLKSLPATHKPKNFAEIVQYATNNVSDWQNIHEIQRKKASEVILAVIVSPNAGLDEIKMYQAQLQHRIKMLKGVQPSSQQIINKIALREAVLGHLNKILNEKFSNQQARPAAIRADSNQYTNAFSSQSSAEVIPTQEAVRPKSKK